MKKKNQKLVLQKEKISNLLSAKITGGAGLSEKELLKELEKIIVEEEEKDTVNNEIIDPNNVVQAGTNTGGDFYFYNITLRSRGFSEFKKKWDTRKLEDNWRRSEKGSFGEEETAAVDTAATKTIDLTGKNITIDAITASLPKTPEQIASSNAKIAGALFRAGIIYKENFSNKPKAIQYFEENVTDYQPYVICFLLQHSFFVGADHRFAYKKCLMRSFFHPFF